MGGLAETLYRSLQLPSSLTQGMPGFSKAREALGSDPEGALRSVIDTHDEVISHAISVLSSDNYRCCKVICTRRNPQFNPNPGLLGIFRAKQPERERCRS